MLKKNLFLFVAAVCLFPHFASADDERPLVVASIKPLALIASDLAGDWLQVEQLLAVNQEPHHVALSFSQRKKLAQADLVLWVGPELETFLVNAMAQQERGRQLSMQDAAVGLDLELHAGDAHYWLDPMIVSRFYEAIAQWLKTRYPEQVPRIERNLEAQQARLAVLEKEVAGRLAPLRDRPLVVDHQAYSYYARRFGLTVAGALVSETGVAGGARSFAELLAVKNVACVVVEVFPATGRAERLAEELGVDLVAVDPLGTAVADGGYGSLLDQVTDGFERCLGGENYSPTGSGG